MKTRADLGDSGEGRRVLVLGIGNVLMGNEGVGVHVAEALATRDLPNGVEVLDGGTGGFTLLGPMQAASHVIIIDATIDGRPMGTVRRLEPRYSSDYPRTLTAHDIGLKDLLDALEISGGGPRVTLYAVSVAALSEPTLIMDDALSRQVESIAEGVEGELSRLLRDTTGGD